jgi:transmembrane sensor
MERPSKDTLIRYFKGQCQPQEIELVNLYLAMDTDPAFVEDCMKAVWLEDQEAHQQKINELEIADFKARFYSRQYAIAQLEPFQDPDLQHSSWIRFPIWLRVVAAVLFLFGTSLFIYRHAPHITSTELTQQKDILPGGEKASLTLADGSVISLSDQEKGVLSTQGELQVEKTKEGEIVYHREKDKALAADAMNTIATPKGGQFQVTLPDGTKVWLNAASSLSYPLRFSKQERRVKMTGEIYFEVAKAIQPTSGKRIPFFVETDKQEVQVLGTHFNVNAYRDEAAVKTTLLEGSVRVLGKNGHSVLLKPGQQATLDENIQVTTADLELQLAWKNGDFIFRAESLKTALRQVARWYDVEIECPEHLGKLRFNGMISRKQPLSVIIEMIQLTKQAKVSIKGRRFIVTD